MTDTSKEVVRKFSNWIALHGNPRGIDLWNEVYFALGGNPTFNNRLPSLTQPCAPWPGRVSDGD